MTSIRRLSMIALAAGAMTLCVAGCDDDTSEKFYGTWTVDVDRTVRHMGSIEQFALTEEPTRRDHIQKYLGSLQLEITRKDVVIISSGRVEIPYEEIGATETSRTIAMTNSGDTKSATFTLVDGEFLNVDLPWVAMEEIAIWRRGE